MVFERSYKGDIMKHLKYSIGGDLFKTMNDFSKYVDSQSGSGIDVLNMHIAPHVMGMLECSKVIFTSAYLSLGANFVMVSGGAEHIIIRAIKDGMKKRMFYKDIYKDIRKRVMIFADLHGQSKVIEDYLQLEFNDQKQIKE